MKYSSHINLLIASSNSSAISVTSTSGKLSLFIFCLFFVGDTQGDDSLLIALSIIQFGESSRHGGWWSGVFDVTTSVVAPIGSINTLEFSRVVDCGLGVISGVWWCDDVSFGESSGYDGGCFGVFDATISAIVVTGSINISTFSTVVDCGLEGILGVGGFLDVWLVLLKAIDNFCSNDWMVSICSSENVYN